MPRQAELTAIPFDIYVSRILDNRRPDKMTAHPVVGREGLARSLQLLNKQVVRLSLLRDTSHQLVAEVAVENCL